MNRLDASFKLPGGRVRTKPRKPQKRQDDGAEFEEFADDTYEDSPFYGTSVDDWEDGYSGRGSRRRDIEAYHDKRRLEQELDPWWEPRKGRKQRRFRRRDAA